MWLDAREVSRMAQWKAPGPFVRLPNRQSNVRRVDNEEYITLKDSSLSGPPAVKNGAASVSTESTDLSIDTRSSSNDSFGLSDLFSPSSSSSSSSSFAGSSSSSSFKKPPRPTKALTLTENIEARRAQEASEEATAEPTEELERVRKKVLEKTAIIFAEVKMAWQHFVHRSRRRRRQPIASHERRYQEEKRIQKQELLDYYYQMRRRQEAEERRPKECLAMTQTLATRKATMTNKYERLHRRYSHLHEGRAAYLNHIHDVKLRRAAQHAHGGKNKRHGHSEVQQGEEGPPPGLLAEVEDTQHVLRILRRGGHTRGVNPSEKPLVAAPAEPESTHIILRLGSTLIRIQGRSFKDKKEMLAALELAFNVDLQRCRNVTVIRGEGLLDRGAVLLGHALSAGACGQLVGLHLNSNGIGRVGLEGIVEGMLQGGLKGLEALSLQRNNLTGRAMDCLVKAAKAEALANLKRLDLRYNSLGDRGAAAMASCIFSEQTQNLERLCLQQNDIQDRGAKALYMALLVDAPRFCPCLTIVNIRQNSITPRCLRTMQPAPPALQY